MRCDLFFNLAITLLNLLKIRSYKALELQNDKLQQIDFALPITKGSENVSVTVNSNVIQSFMSYLRIQKQHDNKTSKGKDSMRDLNNCSHHAFEGRNNSNINSVSTAYEKPTRKLPGAMIIAGPTAAASIFIFLCVAYYFHNAQLNRRAKSISLTLCVPQDVNSEKSDSSYAIDIFPPSHRYVPTARHSRDSDFLGPRRKSMISIQTLSLPPNIQGKRGSNWSALADQEILSLTAPKRHSIFIL